MTVVERARIFAIAAHSAVKQVRKYTGEAYWHHPAEVAKIVEAVPASTLDMIAAAWLHDVIEDTGCTFTEIHTEFGIDIAEMVNWLTDTSNPEDGNRAARKAIDLEHIARAPAEVQSIKCCDRWSNIKSIVAHDPKFARVYLEETRALLAVMTKADPTVLKMVYQVLEEAEASLQLSK